MKKTIVFLFMIVLSFSFSPAAQAQCSMCTVNAEQGSKNGNTQTKGINDGVVYLLAIPYLMMVGIGIVWYRNYRKKNTSMPSLTPNS